MNDLQTAVVIGAGALASALVPEFYKNEIIIKQVISKHIETAQLLANQVQAQASECICEIESADLILLCIPDSEIPLVAQEISYYFEIEDVNPIFCHTSGATHIDSLFPSQRRAVFYPLQTFSKNKTIHWQEVPIFIEASQASDGILLQDLANKISTKTQILSSEKRQNVHLGAVFVSNFVNALANMGADIAEKNEFPFAYYLPLMKEVIEKLHDFSPKEAQTGPAKRHDIQTLELHKQLLQSQFPELLEVYELMTQYIQK
jgi:predicted short-subunit dehydrogenase-like oxidoreductase (DUF2520 family)